MFYLCQGKVVRKQRFLECNKKGRRIIEIGRERKREGEEEDCHEMCVRWIVSKRIPSLIDSFFLFHIFLLMVLFCTIISFQFLPSVSVLMPLFLLVSPPLLFQFTIFALLSIHPNCSRFFVQWRFPPSHHHQGSSRTRYDYDDHF